MMDTLRSGLRVVASAIMNSEMVYSLLIGMGWFLLLGWAVALVVACASVFREDPVLPNAPPRGLPRGASH